MSVNPPADITVYERRVILEIHNQGRVPSMIRDTFFAKYTIHGKPGGTGMGTYSALLIAKAHQGTIAMTTSEAEGTIVTVSLPQPQGTT